MRLVNCEHPTYLKNPHTGETVCAPCGSCPSCMNMRAKKWINNLDTECKQHKYTYMLNLTYDNDTVPVLQYCEDDPNYIEYANRVNDVRIPLSELVACCRDHNGDIIQNEIDYIEDRLAHSLGIPCICSDDISKFFKRFNKYCFTHVTHHYENCRYFCAHEYGPATYRCHAHLLVFFDDDAICRRFEEIVSACWKFGNIRSSAVYSDGGKNYVAQYVNCLVHLPKVYSHSKLRQRIQFSKCPSIGSFNLLEQKVRRLYDELPIRRVVLNSSATKFVGIPIPSAIKGRFFPKLQGYRDLLDTERVVLYGSSLLIPSFDFQEFKCSLHDCHWLWSRQICNNSEAIIYRYFSFLQESARDFGHRKGYSDKQLAECLDNSLYRWYCISKRICMFAVSLDVTVNYLVNRIDEFYKKLDYENLKKSYEWQSSYVTFHGKVQDLISSYPEFYDFVNKHIGLPDFESKLSYSEMLALRSFGINSKEDFVQFKDTYDYKSMCAESFRIYKDTHKTHDIRRYLYSRSFEYSDPKLKQILIRYKHGTKSA